MFFLDVLSQLIFFYHILDCYTVLYYYTHDKSVELKHLIKGAVNATSHCHS